MVLVNFNSKPDKRGTMDGADLDLVKIIASNLQFGYL